MEVWKNEKLQWEHEPAVEVVFSRYLGLPNFPSRFLNCMGTPNKCFIVFFYEITRRKYMLNMEINLNKNRKFS